MLFFSFDLNIEKKFLACFYFFVESRNLPLQNILTPKTKLINQNMVFDSSLSFVLLLFWSLNPQKQMVHMRNFVYSGQ